MPDAQAVETVAETPLRFEEFFDAEHERLFGALCFVTGDRHEAEEIMQDAFLRMWERWDNIQLEDPSAYLFRTAMNVFRSRYRRSVLGLRRTLNITPSEDAFENVDDRDLLVRSLRALTPDQRAAVLLTGYVGVFRGGRRDARYARGHRSNPRDASPRRDPRQGR